ncbi:putative membrane protein [Paenibacillus sp. V4I3]|uniref:hypothetical protein n=1 Tax=Paenibacillus sp. V4I3 TaxID=3042305 RepID=UPI00277E720B|nr:hypothetical protein [Paenibacillus sp. V4I3]MDQ0878282.1 putative membrane protein [Paenibacillus sp. V4I3]
MAERIHPYYYLGGFVGLVVGYIVAKIYEIWVIVDLEREIHHGPIPMFFEISTTKPALFTFIVVLIFIVIGLLFVGILRNATNKEEN